MKEPTIEELRKLANKKAEQAKNSPPIKTRKKIHLPKEILLEPRLTTILRLWSLRNKGLFEVRELQIFPGDRMKKLYNLVHNWEKSGYLEKNGYLYSVTPQMKQKLEGAFSFMQSHLHGKGAEIIPEEKKKEFKIGW